MGTSGAGVLKDRLRKDHPHAYGDKASTLGIATAPTGSSPRVWGQASFGNKIFYAFRIIPTRMGTSLSTAAFARSGSNHPHAYGDKLLEPYQVHPVKGSSPRVWGQAPMIPSASGVSGIIPTRMGTRLCGVPRLGAVQDHPHAYGDKHLNP